MSFGKTHVTVDGVEAGKRSSVLRQRRLRYGRSFFLLSTILSATCASAYAQQAGFNTQLDTINVEGEGTAEDARGPVDGYVATQTATGSKTATPILNNPQSVSVVGRAEMEQRGASTVAESLLYTPGIVSTSRPATRYDIGSIRGFGGQSWFDYLDGMRMPRGGFNAPIMDAWNLERVEVLKGPASVLYGQIMPGGLVNQITKKPKAEAGGEVQLRAGYPGHVEGAFDFTGPIDKDRQFLYRVVGLGRYQEGNVDFAKTERFFIAPSVTWQPTAQTSLTLQAGYLHDPSNFYAVYLPSLGTSLPHPRGLQIPYNFAVEDPNYSKFERDQIWAGYQFRHSFTPDLEFRQNLRYMDTHSQQRGMTPSAWVMSGGVPTTTMSRIMSATDDSSRSISIDNQLEGKFSTGALEHTWLVGADFMHLNFSRYIVSGVAGPNIDYLNPVYAPIAIPNYNQYITEKRQQTGLYVQDQIKIGKFVATIGARHDWATSDYTTFGYNAATDVKTRRGVNNADHRAFTWRAGAAYVFDNGVAPYGSYSTSFEPVSGTTVGGAPFKPTTGEQFEVGVRYQPTAFKGLFTLSYFNITQQNVAVSSGIADTTCSQPTNCQIQAGEVRSQGLEFEAKAELFTGFNMIASYAYVDAEVTKSSLAAGAPLVGTTPVMVPKHQAALWGHYQFEAGSQLSGFGLGAGVRYIGETFADTNNLYTVPDFALVDLALSYDFGVNDRALKGLKLSLTVANLFDKSYVAGCDEMPPTGVGRCYYGTGRTTTATLAYKW